MLVRRMRAIADGSQAVEGRNANAGGEIAIRTSADGDLLEREPQFARGPLCGGKQCRHLLRALQGRPVHTARDLKLAVAIDRLQGFYLALPDRAIGLPADAQ